MGTSIPNQDKGKQALFMGKEMIKSGLQKGLTETKDGMDGLEGELPEGTAKDIIQYALLNPKKYGDLINKLFEHKDPNVVDITVK